MIIIKNCTWPTSAGVQRHMMMAVWPRTWPRGWTWPRGMHWRWPPLPPWGRSRAPPVLVRVQHQRLAWIDVWILITYWKKKKFTIIRDDLLLEMLFSKKPSRPKNDLSPEVGGYLKVCEFWGCYLIWSFFLTPKPCYLADVIRLDRKQ